MKKYLLLLAAAMFCFAACQEKDGPKEDEQDTGYKEKTFEVNVSLMDGVTTGYGAGTVNLPGDDILDFFDITAEEFYKGMGSLDGDSNAGTTSQVNQSEPVIMYGIAQGNDTENLNWVPQTSGNFGHWMTQDAYLTTWGTGMTGDALFYTESTFDWGAEDITDYSGMWEFAYGMRPDVYTASGLKAGDKLTFTEVFFMTDDDDVEYYAYVKWNVSIVEAEEVKLDVVKKIELSDTQDYDSNYTAYDIDLSSAVSAVGASDMSECSVYGVNADGSYSAAPATNFWFNRDGNITSWGAENNCGICLNDDNGDDTWVWCMYADPTLAGETVYGTIAVVKDKKAAIVKVTVNINGIEAVEPADESAMKDVEVPVEFTVSVLKEDDENSGYANTSLAEQLCEAFQISTDQISAAVNAGQISGVAYINDEEVESNASGLIGNWFDAEGAASSYSEETTRAYFVQFYEDFTCDCGYYGGNYTAVYGKSFENYVQKITFTAPSGKTATATIKYKLTFAAE